MPDLQPSARPASFIPRSERDLVAARRASELARTGGADAMTAALAAIDAGFGIAAVHNARKRRAERWLRLGYDHPETRARFAHYSLIALVTLPCAIAVVEGEWRRLLDLAQRKARARGRQTPAHPCAVTDELRLILRLLRRFRPDAWRQIKVCDTDDFHGELADNGHFGVGA